jgi:hypothetical protein
VGLLLLGAEVDERVAEHADAERVVLAALRRAGERELLGQHDLLEQRQAGAAVLRRPGHREHLVLAEGLPPLRRNSSRSSIGTPPMPVHPGGRCSPRKAFTRARNSWA